MNLRPFLPFVGFAFALAACALAYWPGLNGAFIFDDIPNLGAIQQWLQGRIGWSTVVFENLAGPLGRPLSMATFLLDGRIWGMNPFGFKLANLFLHLTIGVAIFFLTKRIAATCTSDSATSGVFALVISAIWLLHPIQVGTVLYVIQRMAMLSALFVVLAMLVYMIGRRQLEAGKTNQGILLIFVGVPLLTALAALSKENGLLAPLLCGVLEWAFFPPGAGRRRHPAVRIFLVSIVGAPIIAGLLLLLLQPELFLAGYGNRRFGLMERLLTQSRVLFDYVGNLFWPRAFSMFRDDYSLSTGLLTPPTTILSLLAWGAVTVAAIRVRQRLPMFSGGVGLFLAGHAMESGLFPLMIYFEHRNYLPSLGIILAGSGLVVSVWRRMKPLMDHPRALASACVCALILTFSFATHGRALVWSTKELLVLQSVQKFPDSRFIRSEMANLEMNRPIPNADRARGHLEVLLGSDRPLVRLVGGLGLLKIDCLTTGTIDTDELQDLFEMVPRTLEADLVMSLRGLIEMSRNPPCSGLDAISVADRLSSWLDRVPQPDRLRYKGRLRLEIAYLYYDSGDFERALPQARLANISSIAPIRTRIVLASSLAALGKLDKAEEIIDRIESSIDPSDERAVERLSELRRSISSAPHMSQES